LPLVVHTTAANVNDSIPAMEVLDRIPPIKGSTGRPRYRPDIIQGDAAYGTPTNLQGAKARRILALMARPGQRKSSQTHGSGLGRFRYVVERTLVWFGHNRRLKMCYEKTREHFQAFHDLAAGLICARRLASCRF
jgi:transposase